MAIRLGQERAGLFGINQAYSWVTDTKSHPCILHQHTTQLVVAMEGPGGATWKAELWEAQTVALRPGDICHRRQLALPLWVGWGRVGL